MSKRLLMRADELPVKNVCGQKRGATGAAQAHGTYSCQSGTWVPSGVSCCPRNASECATGSEPCLALVVDNPTYDENFNEWLLHQSGLPIQIVYGDTVALVSKSIAARR